MLKHQHTTKFKKVADKEFYTLLNKGTFEYVYKSQIDKNILLLLLIQVFIYKFDKDGYLLKHKARLVVQGDLQYIVEDIHTATLAVQTFCAVIAIVVAFNFETQQYNTINIFINVLLATLVTSYCIEGYKKQDFFLQVLQVLYRLKTSLVLQYKYFTLTLEELGLNPVLKTNYLFVNKQLILIFYIDNIIVVYLLKYKDQIDEFESKLINKYKV